MISKTIGYNGVHDIFRHTQMAMVMNGERHQQTDKDIFMGII